MRSTPETYSVTTYIPKQIMAAPPGMRAVYWTREAHDHYVFLVHILALCEVVTKTYETSSCRCLHTDYDEPQVVGLNSSDLGLRPCEEDSNFVGYLAPGEDFSDSWTFQEAERLREADRKDLEGGA